MNQSKVRADELKPGMRVWIVDTEFEIVAANNVGPYTHFVTCTANGRLSERGYPGGQMVDVRACRD